MISEVRLDPKARRRAERFRKDCRFYHHVERDVWYVTDNARERARKRGVEATVLATVDAAHSGVQILESFPASLQFPLPAPIVREELIACALAAERDGKVPRVLYLGRNVDLSGQPDAFTMDVPGGLRSYAWRFLGEEEPAEDVSLAARFPRLLNILRDPETKVVLSLGAAGTKLYAQTVVFRILDALGGKQHIDEIWGTSAGAISGLWYACDVPIEEMEQSGYDLYNGRTSLRFLGSRMRVLWRSALERLRSSARDINPYGNFSKSMAEFIAGVKRYRHPRIPFYCIAFNLDDFRSEVLTPIHFDIDEYRDLVFTVDPIEAAVASASLPIFTTPKRVLRYARKLGHREVAYIDGATTESIPMISVYKKWLIDRRLGIEKRKKLFILAAKFADNGIYQQKMRVCLNSGEMSMVCVEAIANAVVESQRAMIERDEDVKVLQIVTPLYGKHSFDLESIPMFINKASRYYINDLLAFEGQPPYAESQG
jgi:hypothetical protein